jgi:hypothetical protein
MSGRFTDATAHAVLLAQGGGWLQHHTGPAGDGTANVSSNFGSGSRIAVTFDTPAARRMSNDIPLLGIVSTPETISHWSLWDSAAGGTCKWRGDWNSSRSYLNMDEVLVQVGALVVSLPDAP